MRVFFGTIVLLSVLAFSARTQQVAKRTDTGIGYLEHLPPDYYTNPTKKYPLLIFLHGMGERGDGSPASLEIVKRNGPPLHIKNGHNMCFTVDGKEECFIVISPQLSASVNTWFADITEEIFDYVYANYRFDPDRVYLTGLSLGGGGTYRYSGSTFNQPNELAAIAPVCGWGYATDACIIAEGNISVWAFHGDQDPTIPYSWGVDIFNRIQNCSPPTTGDMKFTTYEGVGHNSWWMTYLTNNSWHTPNLYEWLLMQRRSSGGLPTADAGTDKTIQLPVNMVTLPGSGTDTDGSIVSYNWTKVSGPSATLTNAGTSELTATNLLAGTYIFQLTVTDNDGNTATDQVQVVVQAAPPNIAPVANAGADKNITLPVNSTTFNGTGSDNDGSITTWTWTQVSGPSTATLTGNSTANLTASSLTEGVYVFRLTVVDDDGASDFDEVSVTVNPEIGNTPPTANAGTDQLLTLPVNSTNLTGSGSDPDGTVSAYLWTQKSGPSTISITNPSSATASINGLIQGVYVFTLQVTDDDGDTDTDDITVTVQAGNISPTANAGTDRTIVLPTNTVVINGSGSDGDGSIIRYAWSQVSGPTAATLSNASTSSLTASGLLEGTYVFQLEVEDDDGATDTDQMQVIVQPAATNQAPDASAGPDQTIYLPQSSVTLNGSGTDSDGTVASYAWTRTSGPSSFTIESPATAQTQVTGLVAGTYVFTLTVTDDDGDRGSDTITITVIEEATNEAPVVNAGTDRQITLPVNSVIITGEATDADGTVNSILWTQRSGPSSATISNAATLTATFSDLLEGTYIFELTATDDDGANTTDQVSVTVNAANVGPTVDAGADVNVQLPENTVALNGTANDPDGTLATIAWTQVSGPNTANMSGAGSVNVTISNLTEGTYVFRLTVTDNDGESASDDVRIIVSGINAVPVVNAGTDQTITLPTNTVILPGSANDSDGSIASLLWTQVSGPSAVLVNETTNTLTAQSLVEGIYVFRLSATDNEGGEGSDDVQVTVNAPVANQPPVANAGPDIQITLPVNSSNVTGSGTDSDGTIASYNWTKISGGTATLTNATSSTLQLNDLTEGVYVFELTVTDDDGDTDTDRMTLTVIPATVNQAPTADAGTDVTLILPSNAVNLSGSGADPDGTVLTYSWAKTSGGNATIQGAGSPTLQLSNLSEGVYIFTLTVTDEDNASDSDEVTVTVLPAETNAAPVVNAGTDQTIKLPTNSTVLNGSASDEDGTVVSYRWSKTSGPAGGVLTNANQAIADVSGLVEGFYTFTLTATDDDGATGSDRVNITVLAETINSSPVADAGGDITLRLPANQVTLFGRGTDADGAILSYSWTKVTGPASFAMDTPNRSSVTLSNLVEGTYLMRLTVTDDDGASGSDEVTITVISEATNLLPYANAGADQVIYLPQTTTNLSGTAADTDGTVTAVEWVKVSGNNVTITDSNTLAPALSGLQEGAYTFRLTVTDDDNATSSDDVRIIVQPSTVNQPPVVNAGSGLDLILPDNSGTLTATASDPDGSIVSVEWISLDVVAPDMSGVTSMTLSVSNLTEGLYSFQVTVTDDDGLKASDVAHVSVSQKEMIPPIITMMANVTMESTQTNLELWAEAVDDGEIMAVQWEQVLGPVVGLDDPQAPRTMATGWIPGTYEFRFTATDDDGLTSSGSVLIYVVDENAIEDAFPMKVITPNGDYDNERWILDPDPTRHANCRLIIYNRQGQEVFNVVGYNNEWNAMRNGSELEEGVYYYFLKCEEEGNPVMTGSITVIR